MSSREKWVSRRRFLAAGGGTLGVALVKTPFALNFPEHAQAAKTPAAESGAHRVLHIVGYSHIDAAWVWPWRDGADLALTTFRSALDRMKETPGFCYSHSSAAYYRWVERADPAMFREICDRVKEGRWEVMGGWPVEPDCNIPSTESFVRDSLYGKEYCRRALGVDVNIGFNPDAFGHAAGLPTILKGAGYKYYAFMRPRPFESPFPIPPLFWWEGPDGSRVLTLHIYSYGGKGTDLPVAIKASFAPGFDHAVYFLGVGDHGGAVTKQQIASILKAKAEDPTLPELRWSTLREFFAAAEKSPAMANLPVIKSELQHHSRGYYSAFGEGKYLNRRAEQWLGRAETISLAGNLSIGHAYPQADYAESWWKVLFCQFHDTLAGTAMYSDYQDVRDSVGYACETAQTSMVESLEAMARRVGMSGIKEGAIFLFNPLPWKRKALVECYAERNPSGNGPITHLVDKQGNKTRVQWRPQENLVDFVPRLSTWVELPPCGYKVFELGHGESPDPEPYPDFFAISDKGFGISSVRAADGAELLAGSVGLVVIGDTADTWGHDTTKFRLELGRPEMVSSVSVENGQVTHVTRQRARWKSSEIVLEIAQFAGQEVIELRFIIDWHEHEQMLMLEIPTVFSKPKVYAKVPGAALERVPNGEEEPYQDWVALEGSVGGATHTLALINNSTYSYDCLDGLLRTVLIRSAPFARHIPTQLPKDNTNPWQDQGRQERKFWLVRGKAGYTALNLDRRARELQSPAEYVMDSAHAGSAPWERSFFEVTPSSVEVLAIKHAEQQDAVIVRVQERAGAHSEAVLKSEFLGFEHKVPLAPWEIKTLLVRGSKGAPATVQEVSMLEVASNQH